MNPNEFGRTFDLGIYNALASVEEADKIVRTESRLDDFLEAASSIILSYNLQSRFGVSLLHKHSLCMQNEWMIEYSDCIAGRDALVTRPSREDPDHEEACPIVWQIYNENFYPLEFSTDPLARSLLFDGEIPDSFLGDFKELAQRSPIGQTVGLAVVSRELYNSASQDEAAVEYSNSRDRSNIVVLRNRSGLEGNTIETSWSFEKVFDSTRACLKSCRRQCWSKEGGHDKLHTPHHHPEPGT